MAAASTSLLDRMDGGRRGKGDGDAPKTTAAVAPTTGGGQDGASSTAGPSSFTSAQDFIAFDFGDEDEEEEMGSVGESSKGAAVEGPLKREEKSRKRGRKDGERNGHDGPRDGDRRQNKDKGRPERGEQKGPSSQQRKKDRRQAISATPWCADVDFARCLTAAEALHNELIAFAEWVSPTPQEHEVRSLVVQLIRRAITREWPDARLEAFGSQNTQLYMPSGDIDLVVISPSMEAQRKEHVLRKMAHVLRRHNLAIDVQVIARAKVPIIKFVCIFGRLKVDISVNQTNGIEAAKYVRRWLERVPSLRPLIMATKLLLAQRGLSEVFSGGVGSYSVICLVISHIQMHPKVQRGELDPALNLGMLFLDFLELYGRNFGYDNVGISIRGDGRYFTKVSRGWRDERRPFMLSIEDPLDDANDISKGSYSILSVRQAFAGAHDILTAALSQRANEIARRAAAEHWDDGRPGTADEDEQARQALVRGAKANATGMTDKDPQSLLGTIVGISHDMFKSKRDLEQLWESGVLQNKLGRPPPKLGTPEPTIASNTSNKRARSREPEAKASKRVDKGSRASADGPVTTSTGMAKQKGTKSDPVVVHDDTKQASKADRSEYDDLYPASDDSVLVMDEEELASSQGVRFDSLQQDSDAEAAAKVVLSDDDEEERDSRYAGAVGKETNGLLGRRTHLDVFAEQARRHYIGDDDADGDSSSIESDDEALEQTPKKRPRSDEGRGNGRSDSALARSKKRDEYWASKGNVVGTGALSPDSQRSHDEEGDEDEEDEVLLNVFA